jgi:hypothetical protein
VFSALSLTPCFGWVFAAVAVPEPLERFIGTRENRSSGWLPFLSLNTPLKQGVNEMQLPSA